METQLNVESGLVREMEKFEKKFKELGVFFERSTSCSHSAEILFRGKIQTFSLFKFNGYTQVQIGETKSGVLEPCVQHEIINDYYLAQASKIIAGYKLN